MFHQIGSLSNPELFSENFPCRLCQPGGSQKGSYCLARWTTPNTKPNYEFDKLSPHVVFGERLGLTKLW